MFIFTEKQKPLFMLDLTIETKNKIIKNNIQLAYDEAIKLTIDFSEFIRILKKKIQDCEITTSGMDIFIKDKKTQKRVAVIQF